MGLTRTVIALALAAAGVPGAAATTAEIASARALLGEAVAVPTVKGRGMVPKLAAALRAQLIAGGFAADDVTVTPLGETAMLVARYRGTGTMPPIALIAHMDVVEAEARDWVRAPFTMIEDGGFLFGRGVEDNKFDLAMMVATLLKLKADGFAPRRDIVLMLSGDEETDALTTRALVVQAKAMPGGPPVYVLNGDDGGGTLNTAFRPESYAVQAAEKTYADFAITVTNPGGHSSVPRADNAINALAKVTDRLAAYKFPYQVDELTRASFVAAAATAPAPQAAALKAFVADSSRANGDALVRAMPVAVGQLGTTCVATMLSGGHAPNALPQRATLTVNCRIFPGVSVESVRAKLAEVAGDPAAVVTVVGPAIASDPSPLRKDVMAALRKAVDGRAPALAIIPRMSSGATDSLFFRNAGIPSYGVSGLYSRAEDGFAHGLNERVPVAAIGPALDHWRVLLTELAK